MAYINPGVFIERMSFDFQDIPVRRGFSTTQDVLNIIKDTIDMYIYEPNSLETLRRLIQQLRMITDRARALNIPLPSITIRGE